MRFVLLSILILSAAALFTGCADENTPAIESKKYGYEFHVPEGWARVGHTKRTSPDNEVYFIKQTDGEFKRSISLVIHDPFEPSSTGNEIGGKVEDFELDLYFSAIVDKMKQHIPDFEAIDSGTHEIQGKEALFVHYSCTKDIRDVNENESMKLYGESRDYLFFHRGYVWTISCTTPKGQFLENLPSFEKIMATLKLTLD